MVPNLIAVGTVDLWHNELHILGDEFALLPGDGLTSFVSGPDLLSVGVGLPEGDAVLLGYVATLRQHFDVRNNLATLKSRRVKPILLHHMVN